MTNTLHLPNGEKIRTQSSRRYVVIVKDRDFPPYIAYRTDDIARARKRAVNFGSLIRDETFRVAIMDTATGEEMTSR